LKFNILKKCFQNSACHDNTKLVVKSQRWHFVPLPLPLPPPLPLFFRLNVSNYSIGPCREKCKVMWHNAKSKRNPCAWISEKRLSKLHHKFSTLIKQSRNRFTSSRSCSLCNYNKIEDETHFLLVCPSYSLIRDRFFSKIEPKIPFLQLLSHESLLSHLMNCNDHFINIQLMFIHLVTLWTERQTSYNGYLSEGLKIRKGCALFSYFN